VASLQCELDLCKEDLVNCKTDLEVARRLHLDLSFYRAQVEEAAHEVEAGELHQDALANSHGPESGKMEVGIQNSPNVARSTRSSVTRSAQSTQNICDQGTPHHTSTHCNTWQHSDTYNTRDQGTLQHTATHGNIRQHSATPNIREQSMLISPSASNREQGTLQHTATHFNALQHVATTRTRDQGKLQHTATYFNSPQHTASQNTREQGTLPHTTTPNTRKQGTLTSPGVSNPQSLTDVSLSASLKSHLEDFRWRSAQFQTELLQTPLRSSLSQIPHADDSGEIYVRRSQP